MLHAGVKGYMRLRCSVTKPHGNLADAKYLTVRRNLRTSSFRCRPVDGRRTAAAARADAIRRDFTADAASINQRWCGDITYVATWEGWRHLMNW